MKLAVDLQNVYKIGGRRERRQSGVYRLGIFDFAQRASDFEDQQSLKLESCDTEFSTLKGSCQIPLNLLYIIVLIEHRSNFLKVETLIAIDLYDVIF